MTDASMIDAKAVAAALVDAVEDGRGDMYGEGQACAVPLPDGRTARLKLRFDEDAGIGRWIDGPHHDDVFGTFAWRRANRWTDHKGERPAEFDGAARVFKKYGQGGDRVEGEIWWQPPGEVVAQGYRAVDTLAEQVDGWLSGDWIHVGVMVEIEDPGGDAGGDAALWGIDHGFPGATSDYLRSTVEELLGECNIEQASTANVPRWARDSIEAVARRLTDEDEGSPEYTERLRDVLAWWDNVVDDWEDYGGPMTDRMESDYTSNRRACEAVEREKNGEART